MSRGWKRQAGFTLIELLVSLAIFSVVSLAIYSSFATGISAWRMGQDFSSIYQTGRLLLDDMARELKNAVMISANEFIGESQRLSFLTVRQSPYTTGRPSNHQITRVTYELRSDQTSSGYALFRLQVSDIENSQEEQEEAKLMVDSISKLSFQYTYKNDKGELLPWKDAWDESDEIPLGVKITLVFGETDFKKTVFIPHGFQEKEKDNPEGQ